MLAMNLDDAQTFHSLSQIRKPKGSFAQRLDAHQIRRRDAISPSLRRRNDEEADQVRLTWTGGGSGYSLFGSSGVAGKNDWNVANPTDAPCLLEGRCKAGSEDFLIVESRIGEFSAVPSDHTQALRGKIPADLVLERFPTAITRGEEDEGAAAFVRLVDAHGKRHTREFQDGFLAAKGAILAAAAGNVTCEKRRKYGEKLIRTIGRNLPSHLYELCPNRPALRIQNLGAVGPSCGLFAG